MRTQVAGVMRSTSRDVATAPPAVLMVTGAYFPELSGGGLQARAVVRALAGEARFSAPPPGPAPPLPARAVEAGVPIYRIHVNPRGVVSRILATARFAAAPAALRHPAGGAHPAS